MRMDAGYSRGAAARKATGASGYEEIRVSYLTGLLTLYIKEGYGAGR